MSWIENTLSRLESSLRSIIEGDAVRGGIPRKLFTELAEALFQVMKDKARSKPSEGNEQDRVLIAPDQYTLLLPAAQALILLSHPEGIDRLAYKLISMAAQEKLQLLASPILRVVGDSSTSEMNILTDFSHLGVGDSTTTEMEGIPVQQSSALGDLMPKAFLIVNGLSTYSLNQAVVNIGRDPGNHLVINDSRISRLHAQLRFNLGRFVIFDLGSKSGTFVNGNAVSSHILSPGDVIQLASVPLVYGQEEDHKPGFTQKLPPTPQNPEVI